MSDVLDTSRFDLPSGALINAFEADEDAGSRSQLLERVRKYIEKGRATQKEWASAFDGLYEEALSADFSAPFLMRWSAALLERERAALERLYPFLEDIQRKRIAFKEGADPEILALYQDILDFVFGWVAPYQKLSGQLLDLAAARGSEAAKVLHANPVKGEIDHDALTREIIARFPNILAALAK
jgi:uncharacterized NAD(P)/FAD-binding protein YdhS